MHRKLLACFCALSFIGVGLMPAWGQASPEVAGERGVTMVEAQQLLLERQRDLVAARQGLRALQADVTRADVIPNPNVSVNTSNTKAASFAGRDLNHTVGVDQLWERGGKRRLRVELAQGQLQAGRWDVADLTRVRLADFWQAYFDLSAAQERAALVRENLTLLHRWLEQAMVRHRAGDMSVLDANRLKLEVLRAEADAAQEAAALTLAQTRLAALLALEASPSKLVASDALPALPMAIPSASKPLDADVLSEADLGLQADGTKPLPEPSALAGWVVSQDANRANAAWIRPDLMAARQRVAAAQANLNLARSLATRDVTLAGQLERSPGSGGVLVGVGVSIPLMIHNNYRGDVERALAELDRSLADWRSVVANVETERRTAHAELVAAHRRFNVYRSEVKQLSQSTLGQVEFGFQRGALNLTDVLDARRQYTAVRLDALQAQLDYAKAQARWQVALGYPVP